jgi:hypothetical protein
MSLFKKITISDSIQRQFFLFGRAYLLSVLGFLLLAYLLVIFRLEGDFTEKNEWSWRLIKELLVRPLFYMIASIPYLIFILIRSFRRDFRKGQWRLLSKGLLLRAVLPVVAFSLLLMSIDRFRESENFIYEWDFSVDNTTDSIRNHYAQDQKQRGIHVFNLLEDSLDLEILKKQNIEWLTLTPFIPQDKYQTPSIQGEFSRKDSARYMNSWGEIKRQSAAYGFKIHLKPHIWLMSTGNGKWRSDIAMATEADWGLWFEQYESQILAYARLATAIEADLFCIGTELQQTALQQPDRWRDLIRKIKVIYSGPLTYAANWNAEVEEVSFWKELDYIGVQAYFPLADRSNPSLSTLEKGWQKHIQLLEKLHKQYDRPILFTEMGYKSTPDAAKAPWAWNTMGNRFYKKISHEAQVNCYQAFFNTVWQEEWMAGVLIWEWQSRGQGSGQNTAFTLEGKPALNIVAKGFGETVPAKQ